ncbi:MFS transporter [Aquabacterium sp. OR-4]|uniref:MFS transporter n=1 Tax=Aquabacterium sp. OR-4 TaxID=2978127 RepID=UPI0028C55B15|nr:MFS transporter [Aquabacterium sp. OR-4]MDT7838508.1 MFS transporter [Aquabacterium sp. OR-4]
MSEAAPRTPAAAPDAAVARPLPALAWVLLAAAGTFALTMGARQSMGLFLGAINSHTGLGLASISLAFAFGQLCWGLTQPVAGMVADRVGPGRVLVCGVLLVAAGTALIPHMHSTPGLILAIGVLAAGGAGMAGPSVLMSATTRLVPAERRGFATGVVNAGGSFGQFVFAPLAQAVTAAAGWMAAVHTLAVLSLLALPAAWVLRGQGVQQASSGAAPRQSTRQAVAQALADPSYRLLAAGFFVCGFHVAFLATHLPGVVAACQLPPEVGAWALAVLGLFNIVGSLGIGWAIGYRQGRWPMKRLLSLIYATRALAVLLFVLAPKTQTVMLVFAAVMGLTFLSTVPPTAGLVARFFGPAHMGTLFGLVMVTHQIGGFLGAWLGGKAFELSGSYQWMWWADAALAVAAALLHLPIREHPPAPAAAATAQPA